MSSQVIQSLEQLARTGSDGARRYSLAADEVKSHDLRHFLLGQSQQGEDLAAEIQEALEALGHKHSPTGGSMLGAAHRLWMRLSHALAAQDEDRVLAECERGEEMAVAEYCVALHQDLPPAVARLLGDHVKLIRRSWHGIRRRRQAMAFAQAA